MKKLLPILLIICLLFSACSLLENIANNLNDLNNPNNPQQNNTPGPNDPNAPNNAGREGFYIYPLCLQLPLGQHITLDASSAPRGKTLVWTSSDPSVATVDQNGRITPLMEGETIITATASDDASITSACGVLVVADGNIFIWEP